MNDTLEQPSPLTVVPSYASDSSAPAPVVRYYCPVHGDVAFYGGGLPTCPHCGVMLNQQVIYLAVQP